jgi:hypothetical protein
MCNIRVVVDYPNIPRFLEHSTDGKLIREVGDVRREMARVLT